MVRNKWIIHSEDFTSIAALAKEVRSLLKDTELDLTVRVNSAEESHELEIALEDDDRVEIELE